jgi:hypothetical protein
VTGSLTIERAAHGAAPAAELADFLRSRPDATVFHTPVWHEVVRSTYGHRTDTWIARAGGAIAGTFAVTAIRHPLLGKKSVALPYQFGRGAPLAADADVAQELVRHALRHATEGGSAFLEIRNHEPVPFLEAMGFVRVDSQLVITTTPLAQIGKKHLRKGHWDEREYALRRGVTIEPAQSLEEFAAFRRLYQLEGRRFGAPQAPWELFRALHENAKDHCRVWLARGAGGEWLGGLLTLEGGRTIFARCIAQPVPGAAELRVNKALLWRALTDAAARGLEVFDFGISWTGQQDLIRFKEGWNGASWPVSQYVFPIRGAAPAAGGYFEGYQLAKAVWRRLPLGLTDRLGREVTRWVC